MKVFTMKQIRIWVILFTFGFVAHVCTAVALAAGGEEITVTGVIELADRQNFLTADDEKYRIIGQDFSKLIGKTLKVTGHLSEGYKEKTVLVTFMEIVSDRRTQKKNTSSKSDR
jgi:hypothetical protein